MATRNPNPIPLESDSNDLGAATGAMTDVRSDLNAINDQLTATGDDLAVQEGATGWASYLDTEFTDIAPLEILADADTLLPNNAGAGLTDQTPPDLTTFYDGTKFVGDEGDAIAITIALSVIPTSGTTTTFESFFDVGGSQFHTAPSIVTFPKGQGVVREITISGTIGVSADFAANGGILHVKANGTADVFNIGYVVTRIHKSR